MNLEDLKNNMIRTAQEKLNRHTRMGRESALSIFQVAELKDIASGNLSDALKSRGHFFGLHSLN